MGRLSLGLGFAVGYVLGAQAGRSRYEQIKHAAAGAMGRPQVQQALEKVRTAAPAPVQAGLQRLSSRGPERPDAAPRTGQDVPTGTADPLPDPLIPPARSDGGQAERP